MSAYWVWELLDADAGDDFIISCDFQELLVEDVVFVGVDEGGNIPHNSEDIEFITLNGVVWQEDIM